MKYLFIILPIRATTEECLSKKRARALSSLEYFGLNLLIFMVSVYKKICGKNLRATEYVMFILIIDIKKKIFLFQGANFGNS